MRLGDLNAALDEAKDSLSSVLVVEKKESKRLNIAKLSVGAAKKYVAELYRRANKDMDKELPNFERDYKKLQLKLGKARNITRKEMPVIRGVQVKRFADAIRAGEIDIFKPNAKDGELFPKNLNKGKGENWLKLGLKDGDVKDDKISARFKSLSVSQLKPVQNQIWLEIVGSMLATPREGKGAKMVIVSDDGYILDGHHRFGWYSLLDPSKKMKVLEVPLPIETLIKMARSYGNAIGNKQQEAFNEPLVEGINDKNIFKAVFMAGGPGSGKSYITDKLLARKGVVSALGAIVVNSDAIFERKLEQAGLPMEMQADNPEMYAKQMSVREVSKALSDKRMGYWLNGMLPLVIDGTGKNFSKIKKKALALKSMGYDVSMVFVNTSLEVALERNKQRERVVDPKLVEKMWLSVQQNMGKFQSFFGGSSFNIIDNSSYLEGSKAKNFERKVFKIGKNLLDKPLKNRIGIAAMQQMKAMKAKTLSELVDKMDKLAKSKTT